MSFWVLFMLGWIASSCWAQVAYDRGRPTFPIAWIIYNRPIKTKTCRVNLKPVYTELKRIDSLMQLIPLPEGATKDQKEMLKARFKWNMYTDFYNENFGQDTVLISERLLPYRTKQDAFGYSDHDFEVFSEVFDSLLLSHAFRFENIKKVYVQGGYGLDLSKTLAYLGKHYGNQIEEIIHVNNDLSDDDPSAFSHRMAYGGARFPNLKKLDSSNGSSIKLQNVPKLEELYLDCSWACPDSEDWMQLEHLRYLDLYTENLTTAEAALNGFGMQEDSKLQTALFRIRPVIPSDLRGKDWKPFWSAVKSNPQIKYLYVDAILDYPDTSNLWVGNPSVAGTNHLDTLCLGIRCDYCLPSSSSVQIDMDDFQNLKYLRILSFHAGGVIDFLFETKYKLTELKLEGNFNWKKLSENLDRFPELESVNLTSFFSNLSNRRGSFVPQKIKRLKSLKDIRLRNTNLRVLPSYWGRLKSLRSLSIEYTSLQEISPQFFRSNTLERISIENYNWEQEPIKVKLSARSLQVMNLSGVKLESLEFKKAPQLVFLRLHRNGLKHLPKGLAQLPALEEIELLGNPISEKELDALRVLRPDLKITTKKK